MNDRRDGINALAERQGERVFDRLATAARATGRPDELVEATRSQLMQAQQGASAMSNLAMAPAQFWMQAMATWQEGWTEAMAAWTRAAREARGPDQRP